MYSPPATLWNIYHACPLPSTPHIPHLVPCLFTASIPSGARASPHGLFFPHWTCSLTIEIPHATRVWVFPERHHFMHANHQMRVKLCGKLLLPTWFWAPWQPHALYMAPDDTATNPVGKGQCRTCEVKNCTNRKTKGFTGIKVQKVMQSKQNQRRLFMQSIDGGRVKNNHHRLTAAKQNCLLDHP